jgi:hypothetical protein
MSFEATTLTNRTVLFGGSNGSDTWVWNGTSWTELNDVGPLPCDGTALVSTGQSTILFGGRGREGSAPLFGPHRGLTWELDGADWTECQDIGPAPRSGHAMAYDTARQRAVLFGGSGALPTTAVSLFSDTWELPVGGTGSGSGVTTPGMAKLDSLTISPSSVHAGAQVMVEVRLELPAPSTIVVHVQPSGVGGVCRRG